MTVSDDIDGDTSELATSLSWATWTPVWLTILNMAVSHSFVKRPSQKSPPMAFQAEVVLSAPTRLPPKHVHMPEVRYTQD